MTQLGQPQEGFPQVRRDRLASYLEVRAGALSTAADGINPAGPAPGEAGQHATETVVPVLRGRAAAARDGVDQLRAVPANATGSLLRSVQEVQARFPLAGPPASLVDLALPPQLQEDAATVRSCQEATAQS